MTNKPYFDGIKVGDVIWGLHGKEVVIKIEINSAYSVITNKISPGYTFDGVCSEDGPQVAFWSEPKITRHEDGSITMEVPPRPKRMKKVKVAVRPFKPRYNNNSFVALAQESINANYSDWLGPVQEVEVEVEDND